MAKPRSKKTFLPLSQRFVQYFQAPRERRQKWFRAVMNGDINRMHEALSDGQPIDEFGDWGRSALFMASERGRANVMEFLCSAGADVEVVERGDYCRPLHTAVYHGHANAVHILLEYGAQVNETNWYGRTPLDLVAVCVREHMKDELRQILLAAGGAYGFHGDAVPVARGIPIAIADLAPDEGSVVTAKLLAPEDAAASETSQLPALTFRLVASYASHRDDDHAHDDHADDDHAVDAGPGPAPSHADDPASAGDLSPDVTAPLGLPTAEPAGPGSVLASSPPGAKPGSRLILRTFSGGVYEVCVPHSTCLNQFAVRLPGDSPEAGGGESFNNGSHSPLPRVLATPRPGWAIGSPLATADSHVREVVEISQDDSSSVSDLSRVHDIATWLRNTYGLRTRAARALAVVCVQRGHDTVKALSAAPDDVLRELDCHGALPEHLGPAA